MRMSKNGKNRADYGKKVPDGLAERITADSGKGLDAGELRRMRKFYLLFSKWDAVRSILSWIYYCLLLSTKHKNKIRIS